nr:hypothetical protein [Acinetobacter johnsonii]
MPKKLIALSMVAFVGTKSVSAAPMTRQEYNDYRGWELPADESHLANEQGFLVEYVDGGRANHPDHEGYISWSPADVFERSYKESPKNHIERMQSEKHELDVKLTALNAFLTKLGTNEAPLIDDNQVYLLEEQAKNMTFYSNLLGERIKYDSELLQAIG